MSWYLMAKQDPLKIFQQDLMVILNGFSHIHGVLMAFLCFLMACEYSSDSFQIILTILYMYGTDIIKTCLKKFDA